MFKNKFATFPWTRFM